MIQVSIIKKSNNREKFEKIAANRKQSHQTLISLFFRFSFLSLSVSIRKYSLYFEMAKLIIKKRKKSSFYKEKILVVLTPDV
jgi:hypothetical protein